MKSFLRRSKMRKFVIGLVLAVMAVFSLSAGDVLKERKVNNIRDGHAVIFLIEVDADHGQKYVVSWYNLQNLDGEDGLTLEEVYVCNSLVHAYKVWNMDRTQLEEKRKLFEEKVKKDKDFGFGAYLVQYYYLK